MRDAAQALTLAREALEANHEWHMRDDPIAYIDSDMEKLNERAIAALSAAPAGEPVAPANALLACDIQPRPLRYPLSDYHRAGSDGPLHATWEDKPHRLLYDLIAAVRYYAAPAPAEPAPEGWRLVPVEPTPEMLDAWPNHRHGAGHEAAIYRAMLAAAPTATKE